VARVDPVACALFLIAAFVIAGVAQTAWFKAPMSQRFAIPLDGGLTFRGRRVFGPHKTLRGFVVMVPAAAIAFGILALAAGDPASAGLWPLRAGQYVLLGAWAGFGFMAGELPNSFVKRQLGVAPGGIGAAANVRVIQRAVDRLDSPAGMLVALSAVAPIPALTWTIALFIGPILHGLFSLLLFRLGVKARPA
jgi:CDP-2,3-bis-(O-geranylgeranyl)-sn-glycerol synthase